MAIAQEVVEVLWSGSVSASVAAAGNITSDEVLVSPCAFLAALSTTACNRGTPAAGDDAVVKVMYFNTSTSVYDTADHAEIMYRLETDLDNVAAKTKDILAPTTSIRVYVENDASSNTLELRSSLTLRVN